MPKAYLCGSIRKGTSDSRSEDHFWTDANEEAVRSYIPALELTNPARTAIDRNDVYLNYACDVSLVSDCDVVLADLRREKGIGIGAELMLASLLRIPVVAWLPPNSHYHRQYIKGVSGQDLSEWIHPFVFGLCDYVEPTLEQLCVTTKHVLALDKVSRKRTPDLTEALAYYSHRRNG